MMKKKKAKERCVGEKSLLLGLLGAQGVVIFERHARRVEPRVEIVLPVVGKLHAGIRAQRVLTEDLDECCGFANECFAAQCDESAKDFVFINKVPKQSSALGTVDNFRVRADT